MRLLFLVFGIFLSLSGCSYSKNISLEWNANPETNIVGYRLYFGSVSGVYDYFIDVGNTTWITISNLADNINYFAVQAYNNVNLYGPLSDEANALENYQQSWRRANFGSPNNIGNGADDANPANDGISNLMKFALNLNPKFNTSLNTTMVFTPSFIIFTYIQNNAANDLGFLYIVEWSDDLINWSNEGVTETMEQIPPMYFSRKITANIPIENINQRFVRLRVVNPN